MRTNLLVISLVILFGVPLSLTGADASKIQLMFVQTVDAQ